jgi:hypothetical protein
VVTIGIILLLALGAQVTLQFSNSFPGFHSNGDCSYCHNEPGTAYNPAYSAAQLTLDGRADEGFWGETQYRRMTIPVGERFGSSEMFIEVVFTQNDTHLFTMVDYGDLTVNGTDTIRYMDSDGITFLWNINMTDFTAAYFSGMKTTAAGEAVDTWVWKPSADDDQAHVGLNTTAEEYANLDGILLDTVFDDQGWVDQGDHDLQAAATWGFQGEHSENDYLVEFVRPLETDNPNDVQFDHSGYYEFALGIYDSSSGIKHLVSFEQAVFVKAVGDDTIDELPVYYQEIVYTTVEDHVTVTDTIEVTQTKSETPWFVVYSILGLLMLGTYATILRRRK